MHPYFVDGLTEALSHHTLTTTLSSFFFFKEIPPTATVIPSTGHTAQSMSPPSSSELEQWQKYFVVAPHKIVYQDDDVVVFPDRSPAAMTHLLVVPRHHKIKGVEELDASHVDLVQKMARIGAQLAQSTSQHMGFHQWPLRSVHHLHMHCVVPPFQTAWYKYRYTEFPDGSFQLGFIGVTSVLRRLNRQKRGRL